MILDQVYQAIGFTCVYPGRQLILLNLVLFISTFNLQKVPLMSWTPDVFCAIKNGSGIFPYTKSHFFPLSEKCRVSDNANNSSLINCTVSKWMEKDPKNPKCSPLAVHEDFPKCDRPDSVLVYEATPGHTTVETFNNVCSRAGLVRLEDSFYFIGSAVSYLTCVPLGDLIGRKPIILNMCLCFCILNIIMALAPSVELLLVCRFLSGMCYATATGLASVLMYELNPPQSRMLIAAIAQISAIYAQMLLGLTSYVIPNWRWWLAFEAVLGLVIGVLVTAVPESVRWLLIVHKTDPEMNEDSEIKARRTVKEILQKRIKAKSTPKNVTELIAINEALNYKETLEVGSFVTLDFKKSFVLRGPKSSHNSGPILEVNGKRSGGKGLTKRFSNQQVVSFKSDSSLTQSNEQNESQQIIHKKKKMTPVLWRCLFVMIFMRTVVNVIYYSLALSSNTLFDKGGTRHLNMFYLGLTEVPVGPFCYFLNKKVPRRVGISVMFLLTGLPLLILGIWNFIQSELPVAARYVFFLMGKTTSTASVLMINLYMAEVFPTTVRTTFSGICSGVARTCSIFSTLAPSLFKRHNAEVVTSMSGISLICAGLIWLLPETKDRKLPQTPSDLQTIHLETKSFVETLRSTRISVTSKVARNLVSDGIGGVGGLGESSIEPSIEPGKENLELPAVSYFTTGDQLSAKMSRDGKKKLKKKRDGQPLGVIEEKSLG